MMAAVIHSSVLELFHTKVAKAVAYAASHADPFVSEFARDYLESIASKTSNDVHEATLVRATGRTPKSLTIKHGADSEDGELEAKPMKEAYTAHISDDTPASLLRHHTIPEIVLGVVSADGRRWKWVLRTSYRVFDAARFTGLLSNLPAEVKATFPAVLPDVPAERYAVLMRLISVLGKRIYIRSTPLPIEALKALAAGDYSLWSDGIPDHPVLRTLHERAAAAAAAEPEEPAEPAIPSLFQTAHQYRTDFTKLIAEDLDGKNLSQLRALCKEHAVRGYTKFTKEQLIAAIRTAAAP
jgi:hypothetical protein